VTGPLPHALAAYNARHDLELHTHASAEAQVAALSDDIAYNNHDLHDGLRAGLFTDRRIWRLPILGGCLRRGRRRLSRPRLLPPPARGAAARLRRDGRGRDRRDAARLARAAPKLLPTTSAQLGRAGGPVFRGALAPI
jgi:dGTPase